LISEQETYTFTNKSEYEKALKIYNRAKKLSDESLRRFNLLKKEKFKFDPSELKPGELYGKRRSQLIYPFLEKNNLKSDDYFEKYLDLIKPVRTYVLDLLINHPEPKTVTDYIHVMTTYKPSAIKETPKDYDRRNFSWHLSTWGTIYEPTMPEPILQTKHQTQPNFQSPPIKISSTPSVIKPESKLNEPNKEPKPKTEIDGEAVYGPGKSLIGFVKDRKFIPVSDPSMMPNKNNYYGKWDWDLLQDKEKMREYLNSKFGSFVIYESMKVDDFGRLHDDDSKIVYPYSRIAKFVTWFDKEFGDYAAKQGWFIVSSDSDVPKIRYKPEDGNKFNLFFQVQRIDDPMEGEALFGRLKNDQEADELAKKIGLVLDENGVVIGWENEIFI